MYGAVFGRARDATIEGVLGAYLLGWRGGGGVGELTWLLTWGTCVYLCIPFCICWCHGFFCDLPIANWTRVYTAAVFLEMDFWVQCRAPFVSNRRKSTLGTLLIVASPTCAFHARGSDGATDESDRPRLPNEVPRDDCTRNCCLLRAVVYLYVISWFVFYCSLFSSCFLACRCPKEDTAEFKVPPRCRYDIAAGISKKFDFNELKAREGTRLGANVTGHPAHPRSA